MTGSIREGVGKACQITMEQLTSGLAQQTITDSTQVQQACELLCALCDVVAVAMTATEPPPHHHHHQQQQQQQQQQPKEQ
jgi:hypothetical protein